MRFRILIPALLCLAIAGADARPLMTRGGAGSGAAPGPSSACDGGSSVCVSVKDGQSFVTWNDAATGASGAAFRYRVYRSNSPVNSGNCTSGTLIASYILNNSAQLLGGDPEIAGGKAYTAANRQDAAGKMVKLTDLGTPVAAFTGLQVYTALAAENAYYCVVSTDTGNASPAYIGAAGPVGETVATPQPIKYAASGSRTDNSYGQILTPSGKAVVFVAHASDSAGGAATYNLWGDYWEWFLTANGEGYNDGRPAVSAVQQDNGANIPSLSNALRVTHRDTLVKPDGANSGIETYHIGAGLTPNPLVGPANRYYLTGCREIARILNWVPGHYGTDPNAMHWTGQSMGAWGGASCGIRGLAQVGGPHLASMWLVYPIWRHDLRSSGNWPGALWTDSMPFRATVAAAPSNLGNTNSAVLMQDGSTWGGAGGYADIPSFIAANPGTDLPFTAWSIGKYDGFATFARQIDALDAFQAAHRGHAFCWATMGHEGSSLPQGVIDRDGPAPDTTVAYSKASFKLNLPYIAFANSSIDDNPGTGTPTASGLFDGDYLGCVNAGFKWTVTADTASAFNFTVDNVWMDRSPTTIPATTTTGTMASSGSGSVAVTSSAGWLSTASHPYALVGDAASPATQEVVTITSTAGNTITFTSRGLFGTTAQSHGSGVAIKQLVTQPTGPNGGPYASMTVDVAIRRAQGGLVPSACTVTPNGEAPVAGALSFDGGIPVLTGVKINASGATSIACN